MKNLRTIRLPWFMMKLGDLVTISDAPGEYIEMYGIVVEKLNDSLFWVWWPDTNRKIHFTKSSYDEMFFVIIDQ